MFVTINDQETEIIGSKSFIKLSKAAFKKELTYWQSTLKKRTKLYGAKLTAEQLCQLEGIERKIKAISTVIATIDNSLKVRC